MFSARRLNINEDFSRISLAQLLPSIRISNFNELQLQYRNYLRRHIQEREDEDALVEEDNSSNENPNFMKAKDINFRLYPFYINWKKLEGNELDYYHTFVHFGYFGASIYSVFIEKYPSLTVKRILYTLSSFAYENLFNKDNKDESCQKEIKDFFDKMPNLGDICQLIKKKILMMKEVPLILIVLKIYEIYFLIQKKSKEIEKIIKNEFLLASYLNNNEYDDIYKNHFKPKVSKIFIKIADEYGKEYSLPKTKEKLYTNIKYIYIKYLKSNEN